MQKEHLSYGRRIQSGDQAAFSQWDSVIKLGALKRVSQQSGLIEVTHLLHMVDPIGRDSSDSNGVNVVNEFYNSKDGVEVQPSWFAVSDMMPFPTLEFVQPRTLKDFLGIPKRFETLMSDIAESLHHLSEEDQGELKSTLQLMGYSSDVPQTTSSVYKSLTASNWYGLVDSSGKSASSYKLEDIESGQRALMRRLYNSIAHSAAPTDRESVKERFKQLIGKNGIIYPQIAGKTLPDAAETTYHVATSHVETMTGIDMQGIKLDETTNYLKLPKGDKTTKGDEDERFRFLDWYLQHRTLYDNAHNSVSTALSRKGENPINTLSVSKGEVPFWIVKNGKKSKIYLDDTKIVFDDYEVPLSAPINNHEELANVLYTQFPDQVFSIIPTAIGMLFQLRANGELLLPEKGSSYVDQANLVWQEIAKNSSGIDIRSIMQKDIVRVNSNGLEALPSGKRIKLPWYVASDFDRDQDGYTNTDIVRSTWRDVVENRLHTVHAATAATTLTEKARILFGGLNLPFVEKLVESLEIALETEKRLKITRANLMKEAEESLGKKELGPLIAFLRGKTDALQFSTNSFLNENEEKIREIREEQIAYTQTAERNQQFENILTYLTAMRYRELAGGAEALEYYNARPSLLTMYLLFGEEYVKNVMQKSEIYTEVTDQEPILGIKRIDAAGNKLLVVEDKLGWMTREDKNDKELLEKIVEEINGSKSDSAIILTQPLDPNQADYRMIVVEKDGSISNMCGNGVRAAALYAYEAYGIESVHLETNSGEVTEGFRNQATGQYGARLSEVVRLDKEKNTQRFSELINESITQLPDPLSVLRELVSAQGVDLSLVTVTHILGEPHAIVQRPDGISRDELEISAIKFANMVDLEGNLVFPNGINVNFASNGGDGGITVLTYERGVDAFTGSCGTGSVCAASLFMETNGGQGVQVTTDNGTLEISYEGGHYIIEGTCQLSS